MTDNRIKTVTEVLDFLANDDSIPQNIRRGATEAKARLLDGKDAMDVRATSAIMILDDLANDNSTPLHARTLIWKATSELEGIAANGN
jgi:uncharacterized protein (UPF0147 family)